MSCEVRVSRFPVGSSASNIAGALIKARAMANGLLVYPMGGTIDGRQGDHVLLAPPFVVTQGDLGEIVGRLKESIEGALKAVAT